MESTIEAVFNCLLNTVDDCTVAICQDATVQRLNTNAKKILMMEEGQPLPLSENDYSNWSGFWNKIQTRTSYSSYFRLNLKDGSFPLVKLTGYYHKKNAIVLARIETIRQNKSTKKAIPIIQHQLLKALNELAVGLVVLSPTLQIEVMNKRAAKLLAANVKSYRHLPVQQLLSCFQVCLEEQQHFLNQLANKQDAQLDIIASHHEQPRTIRVKAKFDQHIHSHILMIEEAFQPHMIDNVSQSTIEQQIAMVVHELRNPLTALKGCIDVLKKNGGSENAFFQIIDGELHRMEKILTEMLYLSKPCPTLPLQMQCLKQIVAQTVQLMSLEAEKFHIQLLFEYDETVSFHTFTEENKMQQLLINLIKNAIQAIDDTGWIIVKLSIESPDTIQLSVTDNGPGMTAQQLANLFTPFFTTKSSGTGLGMTVVKKIVEEFNGQIEVASTLGIGTSMKLTFPRVYQLQSAELLEKTLSI